MEVSAKTKEKPTPVKVQYDVPDELPDLVSAFGEKVVAAAAKGSIVISLQAFMRRHIDKGSDQATIQKEVSAWKPDVRTIVKQSAFERAASSIEKLSDAERKALLEKLRQAA